MFVNPFKKHDVSEFPEVLVPLEQAPRTSNASHQPENEKTKKDNESHSDEPMRLNSDASSGIVNNGMTIDSLKAEILADVAASDTDTPYDRT
jgi:hypothetical protein